MAGPSTMFFQWFSNACVSPLHEKSCLGPEAAPAEETTDSRAKVHIGRHVAVMPILASLH